MRWDECHGFGREISSWRSPSCSDQASRVIFAVTLPLSVLLFANSCTSQRSVPDDRTVWFVHATDPHLYLYAAEDATDAVKKSTAFEESHDRDVLSQFFQHIRTLPKSRGRRLSFLLLEISVSIRV